MPTGVNNAKIFSRNLTIHTTQREACEASQRVRKSMRLFTHRGSRANCSRRSESLNKSAATVRFSLFMEPQNRLSPEKLPLKRGERFSCKFMRM
jgi:hypothetical protein